MRQLLVFILIVLALIGAAVLSSGPTPDSAAQSQDTPKPGANLFDLIVADDAARTAEANAGAIRAAVTATAAVEQTNIADAANKQTAQAQILTQNAQSAKDTKSTADAWTIIGWTATSDSDKSTATSAAQATGTVQANHILELTVAADVQSSTSTARVQATTDAYFAGSLARAEQREQMVNNLVAFAPYAVSGLVLAIVVWVTLQVVPTVTSRMRDRRPDAAGRYALIVNENGDVYDADRNPYPIARLGKNIGVLADTPRDLQEAVTLRDLLVELVTRGNTQARTSAIPKQMTEFQTLPSGVNGRMFGPNETPPEFARNPETLEILEVQWREVQE